MLLCAALFANFMLVAGHDYHRIVEIGTLLCGGLWLVATRSALPGRLFPGKAGKALALFFLLGLLGSIRAYAPRMAFFEVALLFLLYAVAVAGGAEIARRGLPGMLWLLRLLGVAGALYAFKFLVAYFGSFSLGVPVDPSDFTPGFSNFRFFNHVQTSTLPLLVLLCCLTPPSSRLRWLWLAVAGYWWMALFATSGRGTMLGLAVAAVAAVFLLRGAAIPYLRQALLGALAGLGAYLVLLVIVPMVLGTEGMSAFANAVARTASDPASGRMRLWGRAVELIVQHPLLGVGPMHFAHYGRPVRLGAHPHDWLLQIASEWGLPALACLLFAIVAAVVALARAARAVRVDDRDNRAVAAALLVGAVAILVDAAVSGVIVMPQSQLAVALYLAIALGWYRARVGQAAPASPAGAIEHVGGAMLVAASMASLALLVPDGLAHLRFDPLSPAIEAVNTGDAWPRLWRLGYF